MCVTVQWVTRNPAGNVTHVGGADPRTQAAWGLTTAEAVAQVRSRMWELVVDVAGQATLVHAVTRGSSAYLTTSPDGTQANNLDLLPSNPHPLSGTFPQLPQSLPGGHTLELLAVTGISYSEDGRRHPVTITGVSHGTFQDTVEVVAPRESFWRLDPRPIRVDVMVPFPSNIVVDCGPVALRQVFSDEVLTQEHLQDTGEGWWTIDYVLTGPDGLPDPALPARLTPARITVLPRRLDWQQGRVWIGVQSSTLNQTCYAVPVLQSNHLVGFALEQVSTTPPPVPKVTVPDVVGQREDHALSALWAVPLGTQVDGPLDVATNLQVVRQSPAGGARVNPHSTVYLGVATITPAVGTKSVAVENVSTVQRALDVWRFDQSTGAWDRAASLEYGAAEEVDLPEEGHLYTLSAFFAGEEPPAQPYSMRYAVEVADDDGLVKVWQIV